MKLENSMHEFLIVTGIVIVYFAIAASVGLACHHFLKIPKEIFRKILHGILLLSFLIFIFGFTVWWKAVLLAVVFAAVVYPILIFFERFKLYSELTTERKSGELKRSLLWVFGMFAVVTAVCWGWFGDRYLVLAVIYAWGFGDAAAALIGKRWGTHRIKWKLADEKKSVEGSLAMFVTAYITVMVILVCRGQINVAGLILIPILCAMVATIAEMVSHDGIDTVICPVAVMAVLLPLIYLFGGLV